MLISGLKGLTNYYVLNIDDNDDDKIIYIVPFPRAQWCFTINSV